MAVGLTSTFRFGLLRLQALEQPMILKGLGPRVLPILRRRVVRCGRDQRSSAHLRAVAEVGAGAVSIWGIWVPIRDPNGRFNWEDDY